MQNPLSGGRVSWLQRGYIFLLFAHKSVFSTVSNDTYRQAQYESFLQFILIILPFSLVFPCMLYNQRCKQSTLNCLTWLVIFAIIGKQFASSSYWFVIMYSHACQYLSAFYKQQKNACPWPFLYQSFFSVISWQCPFAIAYMSNDKDLDLTYSMVMSFFIPDIVEFVADVGTACIEGISNQYAKMWNLY